uniref:HVA22-like protein n=1 Tax=Davidia involucrata TaxID=16924 RepID=A0A5B7B7D0_DAVIN
MLGDFITRGLVLVLGYAYPAFECFKTVEKNRVEIEELRFWCQYWIIVALLTVFERIGDIFISWLPMYGEMKLVLFIYLWYPKTKGTGYVYETFLRPYVAKHETDIDRNIQELRARAWDLTIYYWQNCAKMGQTTLFQMIQYLASQSGRITNTTSEVYSFTSIYLSVLLFACRLVLL